MRACEVRRTRLPARRHGRAFARVRMTERCHRLAQRLYPGKAKPLVRGRVGQERIKRRTQWKEIERSLLRLCHRPPPEIVSAHEFGVARCTWRAMRSAISKSRSGKTPMTSPQSSADKPPYAFIALA